MTIKISKISEKWHNAWYNVGNLMQLVDTCEKAGNSASALASAFTKHKSTERSSKLWSCEAEWMLYFASQGKHGVHPLWSLYASTSEGDGKSGADLIDIVCKGDAPKGATTEQKAELTAMRDKIVAVMQKHPDQAIARSFGLIVERQKAVRAVSAAENKAKKLADQLAERDAMIAELAARLAKLEEKTAA